MRTLRRNKQDIYYALYVGSNDSVDEYGDNNGEPTAVYTDPVKLEDGANVSASRGTADSELFGIDLDYSRTICIEDINCPIKEDSILWIGRVPDGTTKHNYIVKAVAISLNSTVYAIKEVNVS